MIVVNIKNPKSGTWKKTTLSMTSSEFLNARNSFDKWLKNTKQKRTELLAYLWASNKKSLWNKFDEIEMHYIVKALGASQIKVLEEIKPAKKNSGTTLILYRGTPFPEATPKKRKFECVYFATRRNYPLHYALGEMLVTGKKRDAVYIQQYEIKKAKLFDFKNKDKKWKTYFEEPSAEFVSYLVEAGYTGMRGKEDGENIVCLFDTKNLKLVARWKVEIKDGGVSDIIQVK
jgi:hypothetical protein